MTSSWTNTTLDFTGMGSDAPLLIFQTLWEDPEGKSFYAYNGGKSFSLQLYDQPTQPPNQLWQFIPSGSGGSGEWSTVSTSATSNFTTLSRTYQALYASGGRWGFALGGVENPRTSQAFAIATDFLNPGMVMYNFSSQEWYNVSATGYSFSGVALDGAAHFVPSFGPAGLVFFLGGVVANSALPTTDTISMFDPTSQHFSS